ncbi:MAG TPA: hypothetical protein VGJ78_24030 [Vicinamibacterales bacterium]|jgi:hypothetical protein
MRRSVSVGLPLVLAIVSSAFLIAQQPAQGQRAAGGTGGARASAASAIFKVEWVQPAGQTGQVPIVQGNVADPNVEVHWYGEAAKHLLTSGTPGSETTPFSAWSGECDGPFAITFKHKSNMIDMTGLGKIRWVVKTSGFHVVRPVVKLADGTMLVGDRADEAVPMLMTREFALSDVRWIRLDPMRVVTVNGGRGAGPANPNNEIWIVNPDLSKVDEVGFADLMPGSGHGTGGYIHLGTIEVFGKAIPRATTTAANR